ncbi:hypothetical protein OH786_00385 [Streptomyces atratus]|jgi:hypothetical protein|nr:hypothetical protein [Streptomyces atratus]
MPAPPAVAWTLPWQQVTVGTPGPEFEARPSGQYAYDFPDTKCDSWSTSALRLHFTSVRGAEHRHYRQPRQDAARAAVHEATGNIVCAAMLGSGGMR